MAFPTLDRRSLGFRYEVKARLLYEARGAQILGMNVLFRFGELDLVVVEDGTLVFVEVRKRDPRSFITSEESLGSQKVKRLLRAAQAYLAGYSGPAKQVRFDLVAFYGDAGRIHEDFIRF